MSEVKAKPRIKPSLDTPFHIDYEWWQRDERDLRIYLLSHLPPERQDILATADYDENTAIDWIDPETGEVRRVDALQSALQEAAQREDFITEQTSLVDAVFRALLRNDNQPLSPQQLGELIQRDPNMILRTLAGAQVYKGLRPWV